MKHILFALFDNVPDSEKALAEASAHPDCRGKFNVTYHDGELSNHDIAIFETDAKGGMTIGFVLGGIGASLLVILLCLTGIMSGELVTNTLFAGCGGSFLGAIMGTIGGVGGPHHRLEHLAEHLVKGQMLLTIGTDDKEVEETVEKIFAKHGAKEVRKGAI